jgi:hypothetical protein
VSALLVKGGEGSRLFALKKKNKDLYSSFSRMAVQLSAEEFDPRLKSFIHVRHVEVEQDNAGVSFLLSCSFVAVILTPLQESRGDQLVQQTFTQGSLQTEKAARLWQGER